MNKKYDITDAVLSSLNTFLASYGLAKARKRRSRKGSAEKFDFGQESCLEVLDATTLAAANVLNECEMRGKEKLLVLAPYFPPRIADRLCSAQINYADTAGNLHLRLNNTILCVKNCPRPAVLTRRLTPGRCWNPQGMKVLFLLLTKTAALRWTYRKIAAKSGTSLGTVSNVINEILQRNYLLQWDDGYRWAGKLKMIDLWTANYAEILLPRLEIEYYRGTVKHDERLQQLLPAGETAAAIAGLMKTSHCQFWRQGNISKLIAKNRWRSDADGNIAIKKAFWPENRSFEKAVPWLLVYADLMAIDDNRCQEVASEIKKKYLEKVNDSQ
jgi:hypothetical protein